ncbi:flagellar basal body P-ring biosynthesis protein FlgA [Vibrio thalassae]|uniref:Flagella basal body P-ring formation protein FlgA n=3 Tax=Vibrio thalassae TaxID=1243014 RepID=A0A240EM21_9VIBR|nr:flagellar basal body P-ring biosynthesis protein FlgA [Vibrio thalassae]
MCQYFYKTKTMTYIFIRKWNFRFTEARRGMRKWLGSAFFLLLTLPSQAEIQQKMTPQDVEMAVQQSVLAEIERTAQRQNWQHYETNLVMFVPESAKHLAKCQAPLIITSRDSQALPVGNLRRSVQCQDGHNDWRINTSAKVTLSLPVAVASQTLNRDTHITAASVQLETRTLSRAVHFVADLSQIIGNQVSRRMRTGQIIDASFVVKPPLVEKGNEVVIIAAKGKFNASTKGIALETGGAGEQIEVQNSQSKKVIRAVVTGLNQVHTQF